jgi:hypothetical protein
MDGQYLLPSQFVALAIFWFGLPLVFGFIALTWLFLTRGLFRERVYRAIASYILTIALSIILGIVFLIWSPPSLNFLGVQDVFFAGHTWPVLPLTFLVVAVVNPIAGWWALQAIEPTPSIKRDTLKRAAVSIKS